MSARAAWQSTPLPAVIVPEAIGRDLAAELRAALAFDRYSLLDRGSYESAPVTGAILETLAGIASEVTGRALAVSEARALRLSPGDYALVRHDRVHDDRPVELVLDLSPAHVAGAELHYRHRGQVYFVFPVTPGALAVVERGPTVLCNHTYVSKLHPPETRIVRVIVLCRETTTR